MRLLLDTHAFLWGLASDPRLSKRVRSLMDDAANEILISPVSAWEIGAKERRGRIRIQPSPSAAIRSLIASGWLGTLPLEVEHALHSASLPPLHLDPMDRLLIAQSRVENIPLVTADALIRQYDVQTIW